MAVSNVSYDFGGLLTDYTVFAAVRHTGSQDEAVVASVGSEWIFGLGNSMSGYWKLGNTTLTGPSSDNDWHCYWNTRSKWSSNFTQGRL